MPLPCVRVCVCCVCCWMLSMPRLPTSPHPRPPSYLLCSATPPLTPPGKERRWDIVKAHASVGAVLYHSGLDAFILVRQFRPAVYAARLRDAAEAGRPAPGKEAGELKAAAVAVCVCVS